MSYESISSGRCFEADVSHFLQQHVYELPPGKILCIAENDDTTAIYLAKQGYDVTVLDNSLGHLTQLNQLAKNSEVDIATIYEDIAKFDFGQKRWDGIVFISDNNFGIAGRYLLKRFIAGLKSHGVLLLETFSSRKLQEDDFSAQARNVASTRREQTGGLNLSHLGERRLIQKRTGYELGSVVQAVGHLA